MYHKTNDFRQIIAAMALLELGVDQKWESIIIQYYKENDWKGWHILMSFGREILRYLEGKLNAEFITSIMERNEYKRKDPELINDLINKNPGKAVILYEQGLFKLTPFKEAIMYGKIGDNRGYKFILENVFSYGTPALKYLGDFGDKSAISVLKEAEKMGAPKNIIDEAVNKIIVLNF